METVILKPFNESDLNDFTVTNKTVDGVKFRFGCKFHSRQKIEHIKGFYGDLATAGYVDVFLDGVLYKNAFKYLRKVMRRGYTIKFTSQTDGRYFGDSHAQIVRNILRNYPNNHIK